jgi:secreted PhoX family phosphatase
MSMARRSFLLRAGGAGAGLAFTGSLASVIAGGAGPVGAVRGRGRPGQAGYGPLVPDPAGLLDLPAGFRYRLFSREGEALTGGLPVPSNHDGMAAFRLPAGRVALVRNHEVEPDDVEEDGATPVPHGSGITYDPNGTGGTTTLVVNRDRTLRSHGVSLAGTANNCAGGPTPWGTWLTCEETDEVIDGVKHGYVFEVDPASGGDPRPLTALGRFEHEAVAFDDRGVAYLTEDADSPFGYVYRFQAARYRHGRPDLRAGGALSALLIPELGGADLSAVIEPGAVFRHLQWVPIPHVDPPEGESLRSTYQATPIPKAEGTWWGDGAIWFVSSYGRGPAAEDEEDISAGVHGGQIWRYDPRRGTLRLVVVFEPTSDFQGPDNITVSPHGYAVMCTDGDDESQFLAGITPDGRTFPLAQNRLSDEEFAGATFSPDGKTLFANIQVPGTTIAIWGPW